MCNRVSKESGAAPNTPPTDSKWKSGTVWCQGGYAGGGAAQPDPPGTENSAAGLEKNQCHLIIQMIQQFCPKGQSLRHEHHELGKPTVTGRDL